VSQLEIAKYSLKAIILGVHGRSRSLMLIRLNSLSPALIMIRSIFMPICSCFMLDESIAAK